LANGQGHYKPPPRDVGSTIETRPADNRLPSLPWTSSDLSNLPRHWQRGQQAMKPDPVGSKQYFERANKS
jgi:hypothetical protein